ncbi:amino acid adenylation domain-containing protein [Streptomyces sp. NPDC051677]|uniref:amino acid adenylation domain-containing protein n=1 Tax=Streptomyces sp. NPDC051677 TaxID=3365669 RepID=UPI0037D8E99D
MTVGHADLFEGETYEFQASRAQQRMYVLEELAHGSPTYHVPLCYELDGPLDESALRAAAQGLVDRHESLRTRFAVRDGRLVQLISARARLDWQVDEAGEDATPDRVRDWLRARTRRPFDLERGPLFRVFLLRVTATRRILVLHLHHIVCDGWSAGVLLRELTAGYRALTEGRPDDQKPPEFQYADYSAWQEEWLASPAARRHEEYWRAQLEGDLPLLRHPTSRTGPEAGPERPGAVHRFTPPRQAVEQLAELCVASNSTLYMGMLAVFDVLLSRYTGHTDIVVGTPVANRNRAEFEDTVGLFVNTSVIRADLSDDPTFAQLMAQVRGTVLAAQDNQDIPFEWIAALKNTDRSEGTSPVFQVMFGMNQDGDLRWELPGVELTQISSELRSAKFDLLFDVYQTPQGIECSIEYRSDLLDAATVELFAEHFGRLLESAVREPGTHVSRLDLLTDQERSRWLRTPDDAASSEHLPLAHEQFAHWARVTPDRTAVTFQGEHLSYADLDRMANRIAHHLRDLGVGPDTLVGLSVDRSADLVACVLAIHKAGGAYLPLDPAYPAERLRFMAEDSGITTLLVNDAAAAQWTDFKGHVVHLTQDAPAIDARPDSAPDVTVSGDHLAYVIYTSGSTGRPKGVLVPHQNIVRLFSATDAWFGFGTEDVWTLFHSYAFDFSVWELWGALAFGGRLVVVDYETSRTPVAFHELVRAEGVTVLNQTPSAFTQFVRADLQAVPDTAGRLALRYVVFGGEALDPGALRPWFERHGDEAPLLVNMYGITETTVHVTYRPIRQADLDSGQGSVIGVPIPDLRLYVLDGRGKPVPTGAVGELYVGGAGVALGYLNRPELTAQRFVANPFAPDSRDDRLYRTGDLVRILPDGDLEYRGRIDNQVKLRGFRVELGEIESALVSHERVSAAVVTLRTDDAGHSYLAAYTVARTDGAAQHPLPDEELRRHLSGLLPDYMVPSVFCPVDDFPLTANGKVDRSRLPDPRRTPTATATTYTAPRTALEHQLAEIWASALGQPQVGIDDGYHSLGGDSIRSIPLLAAARAAGVDFSLIDLLTCQTIRRLAEVATVREAAAEVPRAEPFRLVAAQDRPRLPAGLADAYPMTRLQLGMFFHTSLSASGTGVYHNTSAYRLRAAWSEDAWVTAVAAVCARHDVLRTSFALHGFSEPLQLVHAAVPPPVTFEDLRGLTPGERAAAVTARRAHEAATPFDRERAPLIRFHVQRLSEDTCQLFVTEHHAILDGWSERSLFAELLLRYGDALHGRQERPRNALASRFSSYVALEREAVQDEDAARHWISRLDGMAVTELPRLPERADTAGGASRAAFHAAPLPAALHGRLTRLADRLGVSLRSVLLAAHVRVLGVLGGTDDVVSGVVYNGRGEERDAEKCLGLFLNTLPLRVRLGGGSWADLVTEVAAADTDAQRHRRFPLADIMRVTGHPSLFEAFFNYTHFHVETSLAGHAEIDVLESESSAGTNFAFGAEFAVNTSDGRLTLGLRYDPGQFGREQVEGFFGLYAEALDALATRADETYHHTGLPSAGDLRRLTAWNATGRDYTSPSLLHRLVEEQVARTPDAVALRCEGEQLTYQEMDSRAARLAGVLHAHRVGRGDFVAVVMDRCVDLPVVLLGILKAGAAYVPLDPDAPDLRVQGILADGAIDTVVTTREQAGRFDVLPGVRVLVADDALAAPPSGDGVLACAEPLPDEPAYMIYTSGSTGRPKGVVVSHRAIANRLLWHQETFALRPGEAVLHKTPYTFDVSVWELFWPLLAGGVEVLARPGGHRDPAYLARLITAERITTAHFVPSMLQAFLEDPAADRCTGLKRVLCSGEALHTELQDRFFRVLDGVELHNLYGPTEAAVDVTHWQCAPGARTVPIGRPVANTGTHVLDARGLPVPVGVTGELYLSGVQLALGYHRRPDLTDAAFGERTDESGRRLRMYRTGDLARWLPDGTLEYRGRRDSQIKLRGFRIELQEIERTMTAHPAVHECAVLVHGEHLAAYVTAAGTVPDAEELAAFAAQRLPGYMVPAHWVPLAAMPLTTSGKLDRKALPAPQRGTPQVGRPTAPSDATEERLLGMWRRLLDIDRLGVEDDFFRCGGHSLTAVRLVAQINAEFGTDLPVSFVLSRPTVARQAELLRRGAPDTMPSSRAVRLGGDGPAAPLFLVHAAGGGVLCYRDFATAPTGRPCHALPAPGLEPGERPLDSVPDLAGYHLETVRGVAPSGPYRLGGWSFGGVVAHEMARRLRAAGETVEVLGLIDSGYPDPSLEPAAPHGMLLAFAEDTLLSAGLPVDEALRRGLAAARDHEEGLRVLAARLRELTSLDHRQLIRHYSVFERNLRAMAAHRPAPYDGLVHFFAGTATVRTGAAARWQALARGGFTVHTLAAGHHEMVREPHAATVLHTLDSARRV